MKGSAAEYEVLPGHDTTVSDMVVIGVVVIFVNIAMMCIHKSGS